MNSTSSRWILGVLLALFGVALWNLFHWRFTRGDVYPPYSSLRSDPLGSKALYESLNAIEGLEARRQLLSLKHLPDPERTALLVLGLKPEQMEASPDERKLLEEFVERGGRLVLTLSSTEFSLDPMNSSGGQGSAISTNAAPSSKPVRRPNLRNRNRAQAGSPGKGMESLEERWGFELRLERLSSTERPQSSNGIPTLRSELEPTLLRETPRWHCLAVLTSLSNVWKPMLLRGSNAVVMERSWGQGTLAIATDSYFVSNEALRHHRSTDLLSWMIQQKPLVVFEETHLGLGEEPGFATLARRYRLQFFGGCLMILTALFAWHSQTPFSTVSESPDRESRWVEGRDAASGFSGLLRRNLTRSQLLPHCLQEWVRSRYGGRTLSADRLAAVQAVVDEANGQPSGSINPVLVYQKIARLLSLKEPNPSSSTPNRPNPS